MTKGNAKSGLALLAALAIFCGSASAEEPAAAPRANDRLRNAGPVNGNVPLTPLGDVAAPTPVPIPYPNTSKPVPTYNLTPAWPSKVDAARTPAVQAPSAAPASPPKIDAITIKQR